MVNPFHPNFPSQLKEKCVDITLEEGEGVFIPQGHFHYFICEEKSIAVNQWFCPFFEVTKSKLEYPLWNLTEKSILHLIEAIFSKKLSIHRLRNFFHLFSSWIHSFFFLKECLEEKQIWKILYYGTSGGFPDLNKVKFEDWETKWKELFQSASQRVSRMIMEKHVYGF